MKMVPLRKGLCWISRVVRESDMKSDWQAEVGSQEDSHMYIVLLHTTVGRYLNIVRAGGMAL